MKETKAEHLPTWKLRPFERHSFQTWDDEEKDQLVWSVLAQRVLPQSWCGLWIWGNMR